MRELRGDPAVRWLLESEDPSVRYLTLTEVLEEAPDAAEVRSAHEGIPAGPKVRALLAGQRPDGDFGVHPYKKWEGAHWRLVSLVELAVPAGFPPAVAATEGVLKWLTGPSHLPGVTKRNGPDRLHASMEGNALAVCSRLGLQDDARVGRLVETLLDRQWADGGWNCDSDPEAEHSSFYETLAPMWGLLEFHKATGDLDSLRAAERAAEFFLRHRLFRSESTGEVIHQEWPKLHYPLYWHYDVLQGLLMLSRLGKLPDSRAEEALDIVEGRRLSDGTWRPGGYYWYPPGTKGSNVEAVDWGRGGPNEMITLNALRVLKAAGRSSGASSRTTSREPRDVN
jgi:hypothetical protein